MTISAKSERVGCYDHEMAAGALHSVAESFGDGFLQVLREGFVVETAVVFIALSLLLIF